MRKRLLHIALGLLAITGYAEVKALQGGPDAYGYVWKDSNEPSGPAFSWVDIENRPGTVAVTGLADDNSVGQFNIGWDFHFYWSDYNKVKLGSNGWLSFNNVGNIASCFPTLPTAAGAGDNLVVPYMSDLTYISSVPASPNPGRMFYWTNNVDSFIVQYKTVPWWRQGSPDWIGSNTFQVILAGQDSSITFQYLDTDAANLAVATQCPTSMEIGIENVTGNVGLQVATGTNAAVPADNYAIKFYYPANITFQVPDATPAWAANDENAGQFVYTNAPVNFSANIANSGNAAITNQITVNGVLKNASSAQVWTSSTAIATGLPAGDDSTVVFPSAVTLTTAGQYTLEVTSVNSQDINPSNNLNKVEIAAVNNTGGYVQLSYCSGALPDGSISWAGGGSDDGVAIKIVPPGYPMTMDSIAVFILGDGDPLTPLPHGYDLLVVGPDANGNPDLSNVLQTQNVSPQDAVEEDWNRIALDTSVVVSSGAVFVVWYQGGADVALGTESLSPISRRSYEILGGAVSPYRQNTVNEFLIQVASVLPVGIKDPAVPGKLAVYPNPSHGLINVAYEVVNVTDAQFSIVNTLGQQVWTKRHSDIAPGAYEFQIDLSGLTSGIYFLSQETIDGRKTVKLVVE
jgi:Secretion system C-terminal sorting domain